MMKLNFVKYQGTGNDFVVIDNRSGNISLGKATVAKVCRRFFGVGADGFMALEDDPVEQFYMRYWNADGGESTMCGNGGRCIAMFAHQLGIGGNTLSFNTCDGRHKAEIISSDPSGGIVRLSMSDVKGIDDLTSGFFLDTGSPEYINFVNEVDIVDVCSSGASVRNSEYFASRGGTNVNFVQITGPGTIRMRTYERGIEGETLASGTGAVAAAIATHFSCQPEITDFTVETRGGTLKVSFTAAGKYTFRKITLEGEARRVFEGTIEL